MSQYKHKWHQGGYSELAAGKAVCVGQNYADHIKEMQLVFDENPKQETSNKPTVLFIKPKPALCSATSEIKISHLTQFGAMHHELEIALLIGKPLDNLCDNHLDAVAGIGLALDLTLRDLQTELKKRGHPWERSKSFDGSCPVSEFIPFSNDSELDPSNFEQSNLDLSNLNLKLSVNQQIRQQGNSGMMLMPIEPLLREITATFTLEPGDIVLTGTPAGVGPLMAGDVITAMLNKHTLINSVRIT